MKSWTEWKWEPWALALGLWLTGRSTVRAIGRTIGWSLAQLSTFICYTISCIYPAQTHALLCLAKITSRFCVHISVYSLFSWKERFLNNLFFFCLTQQTNSTNRYWKRSVEAVWEIDREERQTDISGEEQRITSRDRQICSLLFYAITMDNKA